MPTYEDRYQRTIDNPSIEQIKIFDNELGIYYIPDYMCVDRRDINEPIILREVNLKFLKILKIVGIINIINAQVHYVNQFSGESIFDVVTKLEYYYATNQFVDSDLHDDVFEQREIVSPILAYDQTLKRDFIENNKSNFSSPKDCELFLRDRSKLFCLYIFLRRTAILYRDTIYKEPFLLLMSFLNNKAALDFLKGKLRVESFQYAGDWHGTGSHEWLTCASTLTALRRTAGIDSTVETHLKAVTGTLSLKGQTATTFVFSEFNWLDYTR